MGLLSRLSMVAVVLLPSTALAWQQAEVEGGLLLYQENSCVYWTLAETGSDDIESMDALHDAVSSGFGAWSAVDCSPFEFIDAGTSSCTAPDVADSGTQATLVVFYEDEWPFESPLGNPFAATGVWYQPSTGKILDADMALNGHQYTWGIDGAPEVVDIQSIVTHEAGHVLGLGESTDVAATMYGYAAVGEISKRDLELDDIEGLCSLYPADFTGTCPSPPTSSATCSERSGCDGCEVAPREQGAEPHGVCIALMALLLALMTTRSTAFKCRRPCRRIDMQAHGSAESDET
jgi:hypothetical protein